MATFAEIQERVNDLVQDDLGNDDLIPALINQGVYEIAGGMQSFLADVIIPPLPELFKIDVVSTVPGQAFTNMPNDFHRTLQFAVNEKGTEIDIADSFIAFSEIDPSMSKVGSIIEVIEYGRKLYYLNSPVVAENVIVHYYRKPVVMVAEGDIPDGIPEHLQMTLLVNFACWKAYEFIEDGIEGDAVNTQKYKSFFAEALKTLEVTIPDYTRGLKLR